MNLEEEKNRIPVSTDSPINVDLFVRIYIDKHLFGFSEWFWNSFISYLRKSLCAIATILARNKNGVSTRRLESHRCTSNIITFINRVFFSFFFGVLNPSSPERDPFFFLSFRQSSKNRQVFLVFLIYLSLLDSPLLSFLYSTPPIHTWRIAARHPLLPMRSESIRTYIRLNRNYYTLFIRV